MTTDDDLLARLDAESAHGCSDPPTCQDHWCRLAQDAAAALRARDTDLAAAHQEHLRALEGDHHTIVKLRADLAAARAAVQAVIDAVEAGDVAEAPYSDTLPALRAWLASVAATQSAPEHELSADCWCRNYAASSSTLG